MSQSPEGNVIFVLTLTQLLTAALVSNRTTPFRRAAATNLWLMITLLAHALRILLVLLVPGGPDCWLTWTFAALVPMPRAVRFHLLVASGLYMASTLAVDWLVRRAVAVRRALPSRRTARRFLHNLSPIRVRRLSRSA